MKTLFYNGKIYLGNKEFCNAFIEENGKFFEIGKKSEKWINQCSRKVDLQSKVVIPGLFDSHCHFLMSAINYQKPYLDSCSSINQLIIICKEYIEKNPYKEFYCFEGWNETNFKNDKRLLNRFDIDKISNNIPIFLVKSDRHLISCNTIALKYLGIFNKNIKDKFIEIGNDGFPTGILKENATYLVREKIDNLSIHENGKFISKFLKVANSYGITSISTCELLKTKNTANLDVYFELEKQNKLTINFCHQLWFENLNLIDDYVLKVKKETNFNKVIGVKIFLDGSLGSRTASLSKPYLDNSSNYGILNYSFDELENYVKKINSYGLQALVHAIGDKAISQTIDVFSKLDKNNKFRNGIIHCEITSKKMLDEIFKNNILIYTQPCFLEDDIMLLDRIINQNFLKYSYAFKTFENKNIHMSFGTDAPICSINPWVNIFYALERKTFKDGLKKSFYPKEKVDIYYAIDCYTKESAYANFLENEKGYIKKGYDADFVVLNQDIFNLKNNKQIIETCAFQTYLNGKLIWNKLVS